MRYGEFVARGGWWVLAQIPLMLLVAVIPPQSGAGHFAPAGPLSVAGVVVTGLGAAVIVWGFVSLGDALTPFPRPRDGATLHRQGVYRFVRHPIYSGVILAGFGWCGWWLSGAGLPAVLALAIFFDRKAVYEETWLRKKYPGYADYARRVKKFIPGVY
ncbi:MAG: isoprenylcysteine carboxylmethyltransferase family protein [Pseudomonadota bacterium]